MAEVDLLIIVPIVIGIAGILTTIIIYIQKSNAEIRRAVDCQISDLQSRLAILEGRQLERDRGKGAV